MSSSSRRRPARTVASRTSRPQRRARCVVVAVLALVCGALTVPAAALVVATPGAARGTPGGTGYVLPVPDAQVLDAFRAPPQPWAAGHRGVDLAAHVGAVVVAPQSGVVAFAGRVAGRPVVTVRHDDGLVSSLEPVTARSAVGTRVARGSPVGEVDAAPGHCVPQTCVHWGVRSAPAQYLDPLTLVGGTGPVVLLPG